MAALPARLRRPPPPSRPLPPPRAPTGVPPPLWPRLAPDQRQQLACLLAELLRRRLLAPPAPEEVTDE